MTYARMLTRADSCATQKHYSTVTYDLFRRFSWMKHTQTCAVGSWQPPWEQSNLDGAGDLGRPPLLAVWWRKETKRGSNLSTWNIAVVILLVSITVIYWCQNKDLFILKRETWNAKNVEKKACPAVCLTVILVRHTGMKPAHVIFVFIWSHTLALWPVNVCVCV